MPESNESPHAKLRQAQLRIAKWQKHLEAVFPVFPDAVPLYDATQSFIGTVDDLRRLADKVSNPLTISADAIPPREQKRIENSLNAFWESFDGILRANAAIPESVIRELEGFSDETAWRSKLHSSAQQIGDLWRGTKPRPGNSFDTAAEFVFIAQNAAAQGVENEPPAVKPAGTEPAAHRKVCISTPIASRRKKPRGSKKKSDTLIQNVLNSGNSELIHEWVFANKVKLAALCGCSSGCVMTTEFWKQNRASEQAKWHREHGAKPLKRRRDM